MIDGYDVLKGIALLMLVEGAAYALFPNGMRQAMQQMLQMPLEAIRLMGLIAATIGLALLWGVMQFTSG
ncbi:MAG: DUF2065 domain-containing protein [Pseudomonadota bacterium]